MKIDGSPVGTIMITGISASGKTTLQAYTKAKGTHPKQMITLEYIPTKKETLTFL